MKISQCHWQNHFKTWLSHRLGVAGTFRAYLDHPLHPKHPKGSAPAKPLLAVVSPTFPSHSNVKPLLPHQLTPISVMNMRKSFPMSSHSITHSNLNVRIPTCQSQRTEGFLPSYIPQSAYQFSRLTSCTETSVKPPTISAGLSEQASPLPFLIPSLRLHTTPIPNWAAPNSAPSQGHYPALRYLQPSETHSVLRGETSRKPQHVSALWRTTSNCISLN